MTYEELSSQIWSQHTRDLEASADLLSQLAGLLTTSAQVPGFCHLLLHVEGEHLGRWSQITDLLGKIENQKVSDLSQDAQDALKRTHAVVGYFRAEAPNLSAFSPSNNLRILVSIAGILAGRERTAEAIEAFGLADEMSKSFADNDPAIRALAIAANNTSAALEQNKARDSQQSQLMIQTAQLSRTHWGRAGTWREHERAEYGLSKCWLSAGDIANAFQHARKGLQIIEQHGNDPLEALYMQEALALAHLADHDRESAKRCFDLMNQYLQKISPESQTWCRDSVKSIEKLLETK
jgi:tetratricopeptide (TPR) repeat protein